MKWIVSSLFSRARIQGSLFLEGVGERASYDVTFTSILLRWSPTKEKANNNPVRREEGRILWGSTTDGIVWCEHSRRKLSFGKLFTFNVRTTKISSKSANPSRDRKVYFLVSDASFDWQAMTDVNMVIAGILDVDTDPVTFGLIYSWMSWTWPKNFQCHGNFQIYIRCLQSTLRGFAVALKLSPREENWFFQEQKKPNFPGIIRILMWSGSIFRKWKSGS